MSEQGDRDALAEVVMAQVYIRGPIRAGHTEALVLTSVEALPVADAILASDWLAQRDRRVAAKALREAAAQWASEYDEQTREHGSAHQKSRAALRMVSVRANERADRIEAGE